MDRRPQRIVVLAPNTKSLVNLRGSILQAFVDAGLEVMACSPEPAGEYAEILQERGIGFVSIPMRRNRVRPLSDLRYLIRLVRFLSRYSPDLVFAYTIKPVVYGSIAARLAGISRVYSMITGLGYTFQGRGPARRLLNLLARSIYRVSLPLNEIVFFQNPDDRKLFLDGRLLSDPGRAVVLSGSGVDLEHFDESERPVSPVVFLMMARLMREKGVHEYVEAAQRIRARFPDVRFDLLGGIEPTGPGIPLDQVERWNQEGSVRYLGSVEDVRPYVRGASVYVLPSYYREGVPRSALEAMSMGCPIVTTDAPGCRETVIEGQNGFLVEPQDVDSLVDGLERFLEDQTLIRTMGRASRDYAEERFDVRKVNDVILQSMGLRAADRPVAR